MSVIQRYDKLEENKTLERNTATGMAVNGVNLMKLPKKKNTL